MRGRIYISKVVGALRLTQTKNLLSPKVTMHSPKVTSASGDGAHVRGKCEREYGGQAILDLMRGVRSGSNLYVNEERCHGLAHPKVTRLGGRLTLHRPLLESLPVGDR
jgi:hypothetical protein